LPAGRRSSALPSRGLQGTSATMSSGKLVVMMNGLPGAMGHEVGQACLRRGLDLATMALTGPGSPKGCEVTEGEKTVKVELVGPEQPEKQQEAIGKMQAKYGKSLVIVDFTHPTAVNPNTEMYAKAKCPFVMGTTGGDKDKMMKVTTDSETYAVIAPNMCKQIVAFQATFDRMAKDFPGAFGGYKMDVVESHQSTKADTSGTAKAMVQHFNALGVDHFDVENDIKMIRKPEEQVAFGVPEDALKGHAWHTYSLTSGDGSVKFEFKHNVCGRSTYAEGVVDAVQFLGQKILSGSRKRVFSMIDVLSEGEMK